MNFALHCLTWRKIESLLCKRRHDKVAVLLPSSPVGVLGGKHLQSTLFDGCNPYSLPFGSRRDRAREINNSCARNLGHVALGSRHTVEVSNHAINRLGHRDPESGGPLGRNSTGITGLGAASKGDYNGPTAPDAMTAFNHG